ncbi:MAG: SGNH/GDSL hydrolase family protein [Phycisphaerales bacterium]
MNATNSTREVRRREIAGSLATIAAMAIAWVIADRTRSIGAVDDLLAAATGASMRARMADVATVGYYEELLDTGAAVSAAPTGVLAPKPDRPSEAPPGWGRVGDSEAGIRDEPFLRYRLRPGSMVEVAGVPIAVNSIGLRDREIIVPKPTDVRRIAVVGSSITMGLGVPVDDTFENRVEDAVARGALGARTRRVEFANFACAGYSLTQLVDVARTRTPAVEPDAIVVALNDIALSSRGSRHIRWLVEEGADLRYDYIRGIVRDAGVVRGMTDGEADARLAPFRARIVAGAMRELAALSRERGIPVIVLFVALPSTAESNARRVRQLLAEITDEGMPTVSLLGAYSAVRDRRALWIAGWDEHPNIEGHRMLADEWIRRLREDAGLADLLLGPTMPDRTANERSEP